MLQTTMPDTTSFMAFGFYSLLQNGESPWLSLNNKHALEDVALNYIPIVLQSITR